MDITQFDNLLETVYGLVKKEDNQIMAIPPKTKPYVTLDGELYILECTIS